MQFKEKTTLPSKLMVQMFNLCSPFQIVMKKYFQVFHCLCSSYSSVLSIDIVNLKSAIFCEFL